MPSLFKAARQASTKVAENVRAFGFMAIIAGVVDDVAAYVRRLAGGGRRRLGWRLSVLDLFSTVASLGLGAVGPAVGAGSPGRGVCCRALSCPICALSPV